MTSLRNYEIAETNKSWKFFSSNRKYKETNINYINENYK